MNKFVISLLVVCGLITSSFYFSYASCTYTEGDIAGDIEECLSDSPVVVANDGAIEDGVKEKLLLWISTLGGIFFLLAVGGIVYGAGNLVFGSVDEERVKKGKDIIKWSIFGFLALISAGSIIALIVNLMFGLS